MTANGAPSFSARSIFNASALVFASSMVLSGGGFVFHAIASRKLGVADYGALYALISLYGVAVIPVNLFAPVITKYAAEFRALHDDSHVRGLIELIARFFALFGIAYIGVSIAAAGPFGSFLHVPGWEIPLVGVMAAVGILASAFRAMAQGVHDYAAFGWSMASEGVGKVVILVALALTGLTIFRGTAAFLGGTILGAAFIALPLARRYLRVAAATIMLDWKRIIATTAGAASLTVMTAFIGFADVIIVKHFFNANDAGLYSATSLCAKILLYFVGFVPAILIPQATHRHARGERTRVTLLAAVGFVALVAFAGVILYRFFGYLVLHALVGTAFDAALPLLPMYAGAMAFLAMTSTLGSYGLATHRLAFVIPLLVTTGATFAFITFVHPSLEAVVRELLIGNVAMLMSLVISLGLQGMRSQRA